MVQKCLAECTRLNVKGISIPSIGAGNLKYPYDVVAKALIEETASYLVNNKGKTSLELVHFVIFDKEVHKEFESFYKIASATAKSAAPSSKTSNTQVYLSSHDKVTGQHMQPPSSAACSFSLPHGLRIELVHGDISCNSSDAIVNSTTEDLHLAGSGVAGALLKKGGPELQAVCDAVVAKGNKAIEGKVVVTPATGGLKCKSLFHVAFKSIEEKQLVKTIQTCLDMADKMNYQSIAFPAIGTGNLHYPPSSAAKAVVEALRNFTIEKPKNVKVIQMVVFQSDVYEKFVTAFKSMGESSVWLYNKMKKLGSTLMSYGEHAPMSNSKEEYVMEADKDFEEPGITLPTLLMDSQVVVIRIYGETDQTVNRAEKRLRAHIETEFITENIDNPSIASLSDSTVNELIESSKIRNVDIEIDRHPLLHSIKLHGCLEDVLRVKDKVQDATSRLNQEKSKQVAADIVYRTIRWMRLPSNEEEEYGKELNYEIEQSYQSNQKVFTCAKEKFYINFDKMEEKDTVLDKVVNVKRVDFLQGNLLL